MNWSLRLRKWHAYIGLLIAPSVLFFALTGALQIFNLHEAHGSYIPALLIQKMSAVHKDQVFETSHGHPAPDHGPPPPQAGGPAAERSVHHEHDRVAASTLVLKWYFLVVALGLSVSTLLGVWMGTTQLRNKPLAWTLLVAGILLPLCTFAI